MYYIVATKQNQIGNKRNSDKLGWRVRQQKLHLITLKSAENLMGEEEKGFSILCNTCLERLIMAINGMLEQSMQLNIL
jgi:hypothetical protein